MAVTLGLKGPGIPPAAPVRTNRKEVSFILDKSGSMSSCREQVISGVNEFLGDLKREQERSDAGGMDVRFTLTLFDTTVTIAHSGVPVIDVSDLSIPTYVPGGNTALYDALGLTLAALERRLAGDRETPIVVVIMTDGLENSSREFTREKIKEQIERLDKEPNWTFVYLGANQDAWAASGAIGISQANTMSYNETKTGQTIVDVGQSTGKLLRSGLKKSDAFFKR